MNNSTNATTPGPVRHDRIDMALFRRLYYSYCASSSFYILVGTPLCIWFMAAILTSPDMRRSLRNQFVCAICLAYMLKSTISGGLEMALFVASQERVLSFNCYLYSLFLNTRLVFEFAGSWLVVTLLFVYLAQIFDYDPSSTLTPLAVNMGKGALLVLPFALAIILIPSIGVLYASNFSKKSAGCIVAGREGYLVLRTLDYMVPVVLSVVLVIIAAVFHYRRFHRGGFFTSRATQSELMCRGRKVDNPVAYVVVVSIDIACRLPMTLFLAELKMGANERLLFNFVGWMVMDARSVILPWCWLLLEDIWERIKIWRPWYRPAPGIDLTVTYSREENAGN